MPGRVTSVCSTAGESATLDADAKTHRIIYSLKFEIEPPPDSKPGVSCQLIVPLDRQGNSINGSLPRPPKQRMIDVRAGDYLLFAKQWRNVLGVAAYRDNWLTAEQAEQCHNRDDLGYLYRVTMPE